MLSLPKGVTFRTHRKACHPMNTFEAAALAMAYCSHGLSLMSASIDFLIVASASNSEYFSLTGSSAEHRRPFVQDSSCED